MDREFPLLVSARRAEVAKRDNDPVSISPRIAGRFSSLDRVTSSKRGQFADIEPGARCRRMRATMEDPRQALITLRGTVEDSIRQLAAPVPEVDPEQPIGRLIEELQANEVIASEGRQALKQMIKLGDQAAEGAAVGPGVMDWIASEGQQLPAALNVLAEEQTAAAGRAGS